MPGKRHHYLPQFLLRRFASTDGDSPGLVWRGDPASERVLQVAPKHEAAKRHYYKLPAEIEVPGMSAEDVLQRVESAAAAAIIKFERSRTVDIGDRHALALFLMLQHRRTPAGRRELRFMDETFGKLELEVRLSNPNAAAAALAADGVEPSAEEIKSWQQAMLAKLSAGEIVVESTPEREIGLMFSHLDKIAPMLVEEFDWRFLIIPPEHGEVVLPDVGVTMYDPTPKFATSGTGLKSSPNSETVLHLAPNLVLLLRPGEGSGATYEASAEQVERINIRAVASSDQCVYGRSGEIVSDVLRAAAADPERVAALRPRAPALWISESDGEPEAGLTTFTGHSLDGTFVEELYVSPEGIEEARKNVYRVGEG